MTDPTPTCRSVCDRLVAAYPNTAWYVEGCDIITAARLALGQPDSDAALRADRDRLQRIINDAFAALPGSNHLNLTIDGSNLLRHIEECKEEFDELRADVKALTQQLDAANKRAEAAEAKLRELESVTGKTIAQHGDIHRKHAEQLEFLAGWLLDRLVERGQS